MRLSCSLGEEAVEEPEACKAALREAYERKKEAEQAAARAAAEAEASRPRPKDFSVRQTHLHYAPKKIQFCVSETGVVLRKPAGFSRRAGDELEKFAIQNAPATKAARGDSMQAVAPKAETIAPKAETIAPKEETVAPKAETIAPK